MTAEVVKKYGIWNGAVYSPRRGIECKWFSMVVDESEVRSVDLLEGEKLVLMTRGLLYLVGNEQNAMMHIHGETDVDPADHPPKIGSNKKYG